MLRLIIGRSKRGKTEYVRDYLSGLAAKGEEKLLMIVPDQQTFDTEKAFLNILGPELAQRVTVLGFSRLCDYVFNHTGYTHGTLADDSVKTLLMSIALEDTADSMKLYGDKALSPQLLTMMQNVHRELKRSNISPDTLISAAPYGNDLLRDKLFDISLTLSAFDALLHSSFEDPDSELEIACDLLKYHHIFEGYTVCVDSYLNFTEPEYDVLEQLMLQSSELFVTLSDDGINSESSIFSVSKDTAIRLRAIAKNNGIDIASPYLCTYEGFFSNAELKHLEENVFRSDSAGFGATENNPIHIYSASDKYDEADFLARNIRRIVMEEGYRFSDIAVVCRSTSHYMGILDTALSNYDISYFMDAPSSVLSKPLMKLIAAIFECITTSFSKDAVLSVIKSGLTCADTLSASLFENYLFTWNISGKKLMSEFTANPRGFADELTTDDMLELTRVEEVRQQVVIPITEFRDKIRDAKASDVCRYLYELLITLGTDKRIIALADDLDKRGEHNLSQEQVRLWEMFISTLECTCDVIGDRYIAPKRFSELLSLQFSKQDIAFIPRAIDSITVGDIERLRLYNKKIVFVIGAVDGEFPSVSSDSGLFSRAEREILTEAGILTDSTIELENIRERYLCYYALSSASEKLFVSYPASTLTGSQNYPSVIISELLSLFDGITPEFSSQVTRLDRAWSKSSGFRLFASSFGSEDVLSTALSDYYTDNEQYKSSADAVARASDREPFAIRNKANAQLLFGKDMRLSASQVEKYHLCRFMYFCNYGLRLRERREARIDAMEYGTFVHYIMEHFIGKYDKSAMCNLTAEDISSEVNSIMNDYAELHLGGMEDKSSRFKYLYRRVGESARVLISHIIEELSQSNFTPEAFELSIGSDVPAYELTLPTGNTVTIRGLVDRADIMRDGDKTYIRIIDYKTGTKLFKLSDVLYGLNLQMLIYLSVLSKSGAERFGGEIIPAGVLYMPAVAPVVNAAFTDTQEKILKERNEKLRMNGLILNDEQVISAMEREKQGLYIPVSAKGDSYKGTDNLATLQEFGAIFSRIDNLIGEMALELSAGKIDATPAVGTYDACEYCPYSAVCGHREGDPVRNVFRLQREEIMSELGLENSQEEVAP